MNMNTYEQEDAAERWLDQALGDYSKDQCRPGLENRILAALEARAAQRHRRWILALAACAAVAIVAGVMTRIHPSREEVPASAFVRKPSPEIVSSVVNKAARSAKGQSAKLARHATIQTSQGRTKRISEQLALEKEKSYLAPVPDLEPEPLIALQTTAPASEVSIQDLGVQPIQIKELAPIRDLN
jgi:hypothetical protein